MSIEHFVVADAVMPFDWMVVQSEHLVAVVVRESASPASHYEAAAHAQRLRDRVAA